MHCVILPSVDFVLSVWDHRRGASHPVSQGPQQTAQDEGAQQGRDSPDETEVGHGVHSVVYCYVCTQFVVVFLVSSLQLPNFCSECKI